MLGRSREGAWIEIAIVQNANSITSVAPVRERGLKLCLIMVLALVLPVAPVRERGLKLTGRRVSFRDLCRSREGAWIEIVACIYYTKRDYCRSREGAWIEIQEWENEKGYNQSLP